MKPAIALGLLLLCATCVADEIKFVNSMPEEIELWIWNRQTKSWHPPIFMGRNAEQVIDVTREGKAYLAMKDSRKRDIPIGWVDLHEYAKSNDYVGLLPLYHAQGWLTGWTVENGEIVPTWDPIGRPYAWRVRATPLKSGETVVCEEQLQFRNARHVKHSRYMTNTYYFINVDVPAR